MSNTIVFIACSKDKSNNGLHTNLNPAPIQDNLQNTANLLINGRRSIGAYIQQVNGGLYINYNSPLTSAIYQYQGHFYRPLQPCIPRKLGEIENGKLKIIIISPVYGIVNCREKINDYEADMRGQIARLWNNLGNNSGLIDIISDLLLTLKPSKVFGYFAGKSKLTDPGTKYRYFFTEGLRMACNNGLKLKCGGCFYNLPRRHGLAAILGALSRTFIDHNSKALSCSFAHDVFGNGRRDGNVEISFDPICEWSE